MNDDQSPLPRHERHRHDLTVGARAGELDALGAILPEGRATHLASLLTDQDVATLRHLAEAGMGDNTLRALSADLGYLEAWARAATGSPLPWPAPLDLTLKFVAHHLWDPDKRATDPEHGMPAAVRDVLVSEGVLRVPGPHAPSTVRRRLSSWSTLHQWRDIEGPFGSPALRKAVRLAVRATPRGRKRKSRDAMTASVLEQVLTELDAVVRTTPLSAEQELKARRLRALRDRAVLSLGFASGGRRRSEIASMTVGQIEGREDASGERYLAVALGRTKTTTADDLMEVVVRGRAVDDLEAWMREVSISAGPLFRPVSRWGKIGAGALSPQSVNLILKARAKEAGFDPARLSAHGLRAGYLTEAFLQGLSLPEAMSQSGHKSATQAAAYFTAVEGSEGRAGRLLK